MTAEQAYLLRAMAAPRPAPSPLLALAAKTGGQTPAMADRARRNRPYPTRAYEGWDTVDDIKGALNTLERGDFYQAATMADQMWRSPRFHGVARTRLNALATVPLDIKPSSDKRKAERLSTALGGMDEGPSPWDRMFPASEVAKLVKWGIIAGIGVGELIWTTDDTDAGELGFIPIGEGVDYLPPVDAKGLRKGRIIWRPRLRVWHPQHLRWDETRDRYRIRTMDGEVDLPDIEENQHSDGHWIVWCPYGYREAWLEGLVRGMADLVMDDRWNRQDWSHYNERYGKPIDKVTTPKTWTDDAKQDALNSVANRNSNTAFLAEKDTENNEMGVDLELVEAKSSGWQTFQERKKENDTDTAIMWLGQNLSTEVQGGSRAAAMAHELVRRDLLKGDAHVAVCLRDQALWHFTKMNYGDPELTPIPNYRVDPPEDQVAKSTAMANMATAVAALVTAKSQSPRDVPIDFPRLIEDSNVLPALSPEDADAQAAVAEEEKAARDEAAKAALAANANINANGGAGQGGGDQSGGADGSGGAPADGGGQLALAGKNTGANVIKRYTFQGMPIAIESPMGSTRKWVDEAGNPGETLMRHDYGYIEGYKSGDGEELDCYIGGVESAAHVYIVHQLKASGLSQRLSDRRSGDAKLSGDVGDWHPGVHEAEALRSIELQLTGRGGGGNTKALENQIDRALGYAKAPGNAHDRGAFVAKADRLVQVPEARTAMLSAMVGLLHHLQVRGVVVQTVPVNVVDDLISGKASAEDALHDHPVLQSLAASVVDEAILRCSAERSDTAASTGAAHGTESSNQAMVWDEDKCLLGFLDYESAKRGYLIHRNDGERAFGGMVTIPVDRFKAKLRRRQPETTSRINAGSRRDAVLALTALAERSARDLIALRANPSRTKKLAYADGLTKKTIPLAARALAVDLAAIKDEIPKATSYKDLEARVVRRFKDMDPKRLATVIQKIRIMGNLAGQLSAVKETK